MAAFAANSILCRLALADQEIDPASFTLTRLASGALVLVTIAALSGRRIVPAKGGWMPAAMLFLYALMFSFAYLRLDVGTGALILFATVQATMILRGVAGGERPGPACWIGLAGAGGGLVILVSPGISAPSIPGATMMGTAGIAWGIYSLKGRHSPDPLGSTAGSFVRAVPMALAAYVVFQRGAHLSTPGLVLALASGAIASGLGYVIWYSALRGLSAVRAASVQLTVPVLAAAGGVLLLGEALSIRIVLAAALILGGVSLTLAGRDPSARH
jgi:drug/metabolite transporter (DMT)-like permease